MCISSQVPSTVSGQGEKLNKHLTERLMSEALASCFPASSHWLLWLQFMVLFRWERVQG